MEAALLACNNIKRLMEEALGIEYQPSPWRLKSVLLHSEPYESKFGDYKA